MKQIIKDVLDDMSNSQVNLGSDSARNMISTLISTALESKGSYAEYSDSEIEEQEARSTWVCSICGENTADVDYDYIGSGTNHLGCEIKNWNEIEEYVEDIDEQAHAQGRDSSYDEDIPEGLKRAKELAQEAIEEGLRQKNFSQKKHEEKVFGHDQGGNYESTDTMTGHDHGKVWPGTDAIQKQIYNEMTSDGLPEGGDVQAVLESHKLADEIVDNQEGSWIYESPDGGKTVFRRPFSDYDPKNKEEIDWETKEPTGRKFTEYNNGNWNQKDEG